MAQDGFFTKHAGKNTIDGVKTDKFGNPIGSEFDLAQDGAFKGFRIAVLHLYTGEGFDFSLPTQALREKGFDIIRWTDVAPDIKDFKKGLNGSCQLWIISNSHNILSEEHLNIIEDYYNAGYGVYIWGDNEPYYVDANRIANKIFGTSGMSGNLLGDQTVSRQKEENKAGFKQHLITTGLNYLYEGVTIATIDLGRGLEPLNYGSADNLVTAVFDKSGKRAIIDGGFTRLFCHWDTAGTGRYVKNAAAWLANYDQWGREDHRATERSLAGKVLMGNETPSLFFINPKKSTVTLESFWEHQAEVRLNLYNSEGDILKEEIINGVDASINVLNVPSGIVTANLKLISGEKKDYTYVLILRLKGK